MRQCPSRIDWMISAASMSSLHPIRLNCAHVTEPHLEVRHDRDTMRPRQPRSPSSMPSWQSLRHHPSRPSRRTMPCQSTSHPCSHCSSVPAMHATSCVSSVNHDEILLDIISSIVLSAVHTCGCAFHAVCTHIHQAYKQQTQR